MSEQMSSPAASIRLVVIDDNADDRALIVRQLERDLPEAQLIVIGSPGEIDPLLECGAFDAVITDYQLRWSDGITLLRAIKARYAQCPVIMFTNTGSEEIAVEAMKSGLDDYIIKSRLSFARLPGAVRAAVERARARERIATLEAEQARALAREQAARRTAEQARERLAFLADASIRLIASLDYTATLQQIAQLCVPRLADWCVVDVPAEDGTIEMQILTHTDPAKVKWARKMRARFTVRVEDPAGAAQVIRTGQPLLLPWIEDEQLQQAARDEEELELLRIVGYRSVLIVPLRASERVIGSLGLVTTTESDRQFTPDDVALAEELARRAGMALDNARLYAEAQAAVQARNQFLTVASHELKTPLTALLGHTQLMSRRLVREPGADQRLTRSVQVIAAQAQRLSRLVNTLLDLTRLQNEQLRLHLAPLDLVELARQVVAELHGVLEHEQISLSLPAGPLIVAGDGLRLEQTLVNLLQNALKYSPAHAPIRLEVGADRESALMTVHDQGIGIPADALPHLFSRFYRAPNIDARHISGMGMGLFLVQEIVARHGGTVEVSSVEGKGSSFTIRLPLANAEERSTQ